MRPGPVAESQLRKFAQVHEQGDHVFVSGPTKSGKTTLGRHILDTRARAGSFVMVFSTKLRPDETIEKEYKDFTVWHKFKRRPKAYEDHVILQADTRRMNTNDAIRHQRAVFGNALDELLQVGHWTFMVDEGHYFCEPKYLNLGRELGLHYAQGRTGKETVITLAQRPANLPVIIYDNVTHAFVGRVRDDEDRKRLSNIGGGDRDTHRALMGQGLHDFTWFPVSTDWGREPFNLAR